MRLPFLRSCERKLANENDGRARTCDVHVGEPQQLTQLRSAVDVLAVMRIGVALIAPVVLLLTAGSLAALTSASTQPAPRSLRLAINTEGEENGYSEIYLYGD